MKNRSKMFIIVLIFSLFGINTSVLTASTELTEPSEPRQLRLPVHIAAEPGAASFDPLQKEDVSLFLDGKPVEIDHIDVKTRQMYKNSDLSRHFVLSFQAEEVSPALLEGVQYFMDVILDRTDTLTVLSPLKAYRMNLGKGQAAVFDALEEILKTDCREYKMRRAALLQAMEKEIYAVGKISADETFYLSIHTMLFEFFTFCQEAIDDLKVHFLSPYMKLDQVINDLPPKGEGETWWIHFLEQGSGPMPGRLRGTIAQVVKMQRTGGFLIGSKNYEFTQLEKEMSILGEFPSQAILEALLKQDICYNAVLWGDSGPGSSNETEVRSTETQDIFKRLAVGTGGQALTVTQPLQGLIELHQQVDRYYELVIPFEGEIDDLEVKLVPVDEKKAKKVRFTYPRVLEKERILAALETLSEEKLKITDFNIEGNRVEFGVTAYQSKPPEISGLVKVKVELYPLFRETPPVYSTGNILHAARDSIHIAVSLPEKYTGSYNLKVSICDLLANRLDFVEKPVYLPHR